MEDDTIAVKVRRAGLDDLGEVLVEGVSKADVADHTTLEEGERANSLGAVDSLIGDDKVHRLDLLLEGADGGEGDDGANANVPQGGDVGTVGDLMGCVLMVNTVTGEEGNVSSVVSQDLNWRCGRAPGCDGVEDSNRLIALELAKTSAANDGDGDGLCRELSVYVHVKLLPFLSPLKFSRSENSSRK